MKRKWTDKIRFPSRAWCQWFIKCTNDAAGVVAHPVLGHVPTCQRCADKLGLQLKKD